MRQLCALKNCITQVLAAKIKRLLKGGTVMSRKMLLVITTMILISCNSSKESIAVEEEPVVEAPGQDDSSEITNAAVTAVLPSLVDKQLVVTETNFTGGVITGVESCGNSLIYTKRSNQVFVLRDNEEFLTSALATKFFSNGDMLITDHGYRSFDCGNSWEKLNEVLISHLEFYDDVIFALINNEIKKSVDQGNTWSNGDFTNNNVADFTIFEGHMFYFLYGSETKIYSISLATGAISEEVVEHRVYSIDKYKDKQILAFANANVYTKHKIENNWSEINYGSYRNVLKEKVIGNVYITGSGLVYTFNS